MLKSFIYFSEVLMHNWNSREIHSLWNLKFSCQSRLETGFSLCVCARVMCVCMYIIFVLFLMCRNSGSYTDGPKKQQFDTTLEKKLAILNLLRGEIILFFMGNVGYFSGVILTPYLQTLEIDILIWREWIFVSCWHKMDSVVSLKFILNKSGPYMKKIK